MLIGLGQRCYSFHTLNFVERERENERGEHGATQVGQTQHGTLQKKLLQQLQTQYDESKPSGNKQKCQSSDTATRAVGRRRIWQSENSTTDGEQVGLRGLDRQAAAASIGTSQPGQIPTGRAHRAAEEDAHRRRLVRLAHPTTEQ